MFRVDPKATAETAGNIAGFQPDRKPSSLMITTIHITRAGTACSEIT
ncbi:hypothetical protein ANMWB30_24290 [Arthrobacter sp. MWB30]|nr:hypothetical protein ANMWB30_24290 [Arthrobacter sp. MWB30]